MTPNERLAALQGAWRVIRAIRHDDGTRARFEGRAVWDGARCVEEGVMRMGGAALQARRATSWTVDAGGIAVAFADGRPFHRIGSGPRPSARHDCPPDRYLLRYDFGCWPVWTCRWRVVGPRKGYRALTVHVRPPCHSWRHRADDDDGPRV